MPKFCFVVKDTTYFGDSMRDVFLQAFEVKYDVTETSIVFSLRPRHSDKTFVKCPTSYTREYTLEEALHDMVDRSFHKFGSMFKQILNH
jgi:hypothetical protein